MATKNRQVHLQIRASQGRCSAFCEYLHSPEDGECRLFGTLTWTNPHRTPLRLKACKDAEDS